MLRISRLCPTASSCAPLGRSAVVFRKPFAAFGFASVPQADGSDWQKLAEHRQNRGRTVADEAMTSFVVEYRQKIGIKSAEYWQTIFGAENCDATDDRGHLNAVKVRHPKRPCTTLLAALKCPTAS